MPPPSGRTPEPPSFTPPPTPEIAVRTMDTDMKSIARGESSPMPEMITAPVSEKEPVFRPETQPGNVSTIESESPKPKGKVMVWIIGTLVLVVIAVAAYFAYPLIFSTEPETVSPPSSDTPPVAVIPHQSFFITPAPQQADLRLTDTLFTTIASSLQTIAQSASVPGGTLQEVRVSEQGGSQVPFKIFFSAFLPQFLASDLGNWFEDDFTTFIYYDADGQWPGMAARIKNGVNFGEVRTAMSALENAQIDRFYLFSPGVFAAFTDGQINGKPTRYAVGSQKGASFNYGVVGNYFVVSASYNGLKAAAPLMGI